MKIAFLSHTRCYSISKVNAKNLICFMISHQFRSNFIHKSFESPEKLEQFCRKLKFQAGIFKKFDFFLNFSSSKEMREITKELKGEISSLNSLIETAISKFPPNLVSKFVAYNEKVCLYHFNSVRKKRKQSKVQLEYHCHQRSIWKK